jgi:glycerol-3-phosphate acyltransferase PlsY
MRRVTTLACALLGFALGSIPFAWILGRIFAGVDIRRLGSGNVGATNLARSLGYRAGLVAFLLDAAKGAAAVLLARRFAPGVESAPLWAGGMAVAGHMFTPFLRFRGGKGVATGAGVFAVLAPASILAALAVFVLAVAIGRMVSLASVLACVALPIAQLALGTGAGTVVLACLVGALVIARHRPNLARILQGTEPRVGGGRPR